LVLGAAWCWVSSVLSCSFIYGVHQRQSVENSEWIFVAVESCRKLTGISSFWDFLFLPCILELERDSELRSPTSRTCEITQQIGNLLHTNSTRQQTNQTNQTGRLPLPYFYHPNQHSNAAMLSSAACHGIWFFILYFVLGVFSVSGVLFVICSSSWIVFNCGPKFSIVLLLWKVQALWHP
jgi:hypothetical protein